MAKRASKLFYLAGITRHAGDHFTSLGVPRRDLMAEDIARLPDDVYAQITGTPPFVVGSPYRGPLYAEAKPALSTAEGPVAEREPPPPPATPAQE